MNQSTMLFIIFERQNNLLSRFYFFKYIQKYIYLKKNKVYFLGNETFNFAYFI